MEGVKKTRTPLNETQLAEILMGCSKRLSPYHMGLIRRLLGEHKYLKSINKEDGYE